MWEAPVPRIRSFRSRMKNNDGFTLVELMVAMIIMAVGMLGVLETINVSLQHNLKNELRNEGLKVGERYMADLRGKAFTSYSDAYTPMVVSSRFRRVSKPFVVERSTLVMANDATGATSRQLTVSVKWAYRNVTSVNRVVSVVARP